MPRIPPGSGRRSERRPAPADREERAVSTTHSGRTGFGERLRRLRLDADLTGKQLAERLGWPASKVSRLEHGRQTATTADIAAWTAALGISPEMRDQLTEDLRSLAVEYATWRRQLRRGSAPRQRVGRLLDESATQLRALQTSVVPGLLQTADYARAVFEGLAQLRPRPDVDAAVRERARRQSVLYESGHDFRFLITEAAVRARVGTPAVHRAQLDRLLVLAGLDTVEIAILDWAAHTITPPDHSFDLFDDRLVLVETLNAELAIREPDDIALYARVFDLYWDAALHGSEATQLITRIALEID